MGSLAGKRLVQTCFLRLSLQVERKSLFPFTSIPSAPYTITETVKKKKKKKPGPSSRHTEVKTSPWSFTGVMSMGRLLFSIRNFTSAEEKKNDVFNESLYNLRRIHAGAVDTNGLVFPEIWSGSKCHRSGHFPTLLTPAPPALM